MAQVSRDAEKDIFGLEERERERAGMYISHVEWPLSFSGFEAEMEFEVNL